MDCEIISGGLIAPGNKGTYLYLCMTMKLFSVEYIDPVSQRNASITMYADDKTDARDKFYDAHPEVEQIIKIKKANYD